MRKIYKISALILILFFSINAASCYSAPAKQKAESPAKKLYRRLTKNFSRNRNDYPDFTDEEFANFREIKTTGIAEGVLYRSSSPINDWGNRNITADKLSEAAGIKTFVNLVDTPEKMRSYKGLQQTYYITGKATALNFDLKFLSKNFQEKLAKALKFIAENEPPFLIHCNLGKDRTGLVCAVIEAFMGASPDEIAADYAKSFYNYFKVMPYSEDYYFIVNNEIRSFLASMLNVKNIDDTDLSLAAEKYLFRIGLSQNDISNLRAKLKK